MENIKKFIKDYFNIYLSNIYSKEYLRSKNQIPYKYNYNFSVKDFTNELDTQHYIISTIYDFATKDNLHTNNQYTTKVIMNFIENRFMIIVDFSLFDYIDGFNNIIFVNNSFIEHKSNHEVVIDTNDYNEFVQYWNNHFINDSTIMHENLILMKGI